MTEQSISTEQKAPQRGWDEAYRNHDSDSLWQEDPIPFLPQVIEKIREDGLETVIDLGCGDGRNLIPLAQAKFMCTGIDLSKVALTRAYHRLNQLGLNAFLIPGDISELVFLEGSVEVITCLDVFGQLPKPEKVISEARRILAPGGIFILNAFTPDDEAFGLGEKISEKCFNYKETLFRFFDKDEIIGFFNEWEILEIRQESWIDPPHGDFRPFEHRHENWVLFARNP